MSAPVAPPRRGVLVLAVLFVLLVVGSGALALTSDAFRSTADRTSTLRSATERLTVFNSSGNVYLVPSVDGEVRVRTQSEFGLRAPQLVESATSSGLVLQAHCDDAPGMNCRVNYTVEVPPDFDVRVQAMSGVVTARGLTGDLALEVGFGHVSLFDVSGPVTVRAQDALVDGLGLTSDSVAVDNHSGDVSLDLLTPPGNIRVRTTFGSLDIAVPAEQQRYRVDANARSGSERIGVATDPASANRISASTEFGTIRIRPTGTEPDEVRARPDMPDMPSVPDMAEIPLFPPIPPEPPVKVPAN